MAKKDPKEPKTPPTPKKQKSPKTKGKQKPGEEIANKPQSPNEPTPPQPVEEAPMQPQSILKPETTGDKKKDVSPPKGGDAKGEIQKETTPKMKDRPRPSPKRSSRENKQESPRMRMRRGIRGSKEQVKTRPARPSEPINEPQPEEEGSDFLAFLVGEMVKKKRDEVFLHFHRAPHEYQEKIGLWLKALAGKEYESDFVESVNAFYTLLLMQLKNKRIQAPFDKLPPKRDLKQFHNYVETSVLDLVEEKIDKEIAELLKEYYKENPDSMVYQDVKQAKEAEVEKKKRRGRAPSTFFANQPKPPGGIICYGVAFSDNRSTN